MWATGGARWALRRSAWRRFSSCSSCSPPGRRGPATRTWPGVPGLPGGAPPNSAPPADQAPARRGGPAGPAPATRPSQPREPPGTRRSTEMRSSLPGPRGQADAAPWRRWLLPLGGTASLLALLALSHGAPPGMTLSYSRFVADVGVGAVRAATIDPAGQVTGSLASGQPFATTIPAALGGNGLAGDLAAHHVQVTATAAMPSSLLSVLIGLLLLLIGGLLYAGVRSARRPA